ncbi:DUF3726 domain-containing protein [Shimia haliotis]|uniref:DUF3726 domain-containing protein n=1 Tax=Shimia haliotis TaxID=1280847 RepID=A0A1I4ACD0_9RHOB|nr:DUF3726 domain-containing protein [Shimia haliotis]SFK53611.1 Protein of unknown function [Shimia haliotis]
MTVSFNEVEAMAKKAARGAGYAWGMAEEAGWATRWLCARDLDGCAALAMALQEINGTKIRPISFENGELRVAEGAACPVHAGAALSDFAADLRQGPVRLSHVAVPMLLLPFAANVARRIGEPVTVRGNAFEAVVQADAASVTGDIAVVSDSVVVTSGGTLGDAASGAARATPTKADWATLGEFAHRTYAPATEASRLKGAGAGTNDND